MLYPTIEVKSLRIIRSLLLVMAATACMLSSCKEQGKGLVGADREAPAAEAAAEESASGQGTSGEEAAATDQAPRFIDIALPGTDDKVIRVSDYVAKNRLTLIDFWASWCGPCRAEMPYVVKTYRAFADKGFEIVGVSLDNDRDAWLDAIRELQMTWPQMSDLKGWDCAGAADYDVQSIPANVLINRQGIIVATDLRGDNLYETVGRLLQ